MILCAPEALNSTVELNLCAALRSGHMYPAVPFEINHVIYVRRTIAVKAEHTLGCCPREDKLAQLESL